MLNLKNKYISFEETDDRVNIYDSLGRYITYIDKENDDWREDLNCLYEEKDNIRLIYLLKRFDSDIGNYYESSIDMFKEVYHNEIQDLNEANEILPDLLLQLLDKNLVEKEILSFDCINKIGKYFVYYYC